MRPARTKAFQQSHRTKPNPTLITVRDPIRPDGFYGVSKAAGEAIARMYHEVHGLELICLRIGSMNKEDDPRTDPRLKAHGLAIGIWFNW